MNTNDSPKRLLSIVSAMNAGGAETFLMKVYRELDKSKYQMDFCVASREEGFYNKEIISMGGKIYYYTPKSKNFLKSFINMKDIVKKEKYEYVMRVSQHSLATIDLIAAKFGGARILVQRSSNTDSGSNGSRRLHRMFKFLPMKIPTIKIAPSTEAAEYTFGKNCVKKGKAILIRNGIAVDDFIFNQERRDKIRIEFNINDKFVVGHIGRFNVQKNHSFLIDMFAEIVKKHANSVLILVGKGELENEIKNKIETLGLTGKVIFTGVRSDIPDLLMAMDVFIFPSFFEGMPNTVIEAQATGLRCMVSDSLTKEVGFTDLVEFLPLELGPVKWAKAALRYKTSYERRNMKKEFIKAGYDIRSTVEIFVQYIFQI
jgi:glycosyltransferase involved in cell wall biosynthesis